MYLGSDEKTLIERIPVEIDGVEVEVALVHIDAPEGEGWNRFECVEDLKGGVGMAIDIYLDSPQIKMHFFNEEGSIGIDWNEERVDRPLEVSIGYADGVTRSEEQMLQDMRANVSSFLNRYGLISPVKPYGYLYDTSYIYQRPLKLEQSLRLNSLIERLLIDLKL